MPPIFHTSIVPLIKKINRKEFSFPVDLFDCVIKSVSNKEFYLARENLEIRAIIKSVKVETAESKQNWQKAPIIKPCRYKSQTVKRAIKIVCNPSSSHAFDLPKIVRIAKQNAIK